MPIADARRRLVNFRISLDEHELIRRGCARSGMRSISEFARMAVLQRATTFLGPQRLLAEDLGTLSHELAELDAALEQLQGGIRHMLGSVGSEAD
jgi:uncharacterized protein (DUF1778 family)